MTTNTLDPGASGQSSVVEGKDSSSDPFAFYITAINAARVLENSQSDYNGALRVYVLAYDILVSNNLEAQAMPLENGGRMGDGAISKESLERKISELEDLTDMHYELDLEERYVRARDSYNEYLKAKEDALLLLPMEKTAMLHLPGLRAYAEIVDRARAREASGRPNAAFDLYVLALDRLEFGLGSVVSAFVAAKMIDDSFSGEALEKKIGWLKRTLKRDHEPGLEGRSRKALAFGERVTSAPEQSPSAQPSSLAPVYS